MTFQDEYFEMKYKLENLIGEFVELCWRTERDPKTEIDAIVCDVGRNKEIDI